MTGLWTIFRNRRWFQFWLRRFLEPCQAQILDWIKAAIDLPCASRVLLTTIHRSKIELLKLSRKVSFSIPGYIQYCMPSRWFCRCRGNSYSCFPKIFHFIYVSICELEFLTFLSECPVINSQSVSFLFELQCHALNFPHFPRTRATICLKTNSIKGLLAVDGQNCISANSWSAGWPLLTK